MTKKILEPQKELEVRAEVDVLVCGGGPAGIIAAQAAAKAGAKTLLVESYSYLGGNLTIGIPIVGYLGRKGNTVIKGLALDFVDRLHAIGKATGQRRCPLHVGEVMISPEAVKELCIQICEEEHIDVLLHTFCSDVIMEGNTIKGVIIESKAGRQVILAKQIIDCTGDGDIAFRAGAPMLKGNDKGQMQPPTIMISMKGVDLQKFRTEIADHPDEYDVDVIPNEFFRPDLNFTFVGMRKQLAEAKAKKGYDIHVDRTIFSTSVEPDEVWVNMSRVNGVDCTDPASETKGFFEATKQNKVVAKYLKECVPGFENAWVGRIAPILGMRESRRIVGEYTLTEEDILKCHRFDDVVTVAAYPIDLHHPVGGDCTLEWCPDCYDIPFRCMVPQKIDNLLVAGRCISATHLAMASTRVMSICMAEGEAVGHAAAQAIRDNVQPRNIDVKKLQETLKAEGVYFRPKE